MKIITWNCNGAFRKKVEAILQFQADIYVIQECESPEQAKGIYQQYFSDFLWKGANKNKGIGIFVRAGIKLKELHWPDENLELFLPVLLNEKIQLLAVWAKQANSPTFQYIGQIWKYLQLNLEQLDETVLICGDFNSNSKWDVWDRWWNHSDVVNKLEKQNIYSIYHRNFTEQQGHESQPTFFLQRNKLKPYHIDYIFASDQYWNLKSVKFKIGDVQYWLSLSDHLPLYCELNPFSLSYI